MSDAFTILTTADPDIELLEKFSLGVFQHASAQGRSVSLIIVDAIGGYENPPQFIPLFLKQYSSHKIKWIEYTGSNDKTSASEAALKWVNDPPVILMDPDMLDNLKDIPSFLEAHNGGAEMVFSWRVHREGLSWGRRLLTFTFNIIVRVMFRLPIHDINTPMVSLSANTLNLLFSIRDKLDERISNRLGGAHALLGQLAEVPISTREIEGRASTFSAWMLICVGLSWLKDLVLFWFLEERLFSRSARPKA
jgi:hypothetical protein